MRKGIPYKGFYYNRKKNFYSSVILRREATKDIMRFFANAQNDNPQGVFLYYKRRANFITLYISTAAAARSAFSSGANKLFPTPLIIPFAAIVPTAVLA